MRILFITGEYPPMRGGVGDYTAHLAHPLATRGHEVAVLTATGAAGADTPGVTILPRVDDWGVGTWRQIARVARDFDLLHIQYQAAAFGMGVAPQLMPWVLRRWTRRPVMTTFHDLRVPYLFPKAGPLRERSVRFMARASSGVIATNEEDAATLEAWGVRALWQVAIGANLPVDIPPTDPATWRARWGLPADAPLLSHFGFVNRSKDVATLLRAVAQLRETRSGVHLLMIGERLGASDPSNQRYLAEIEALAAGLGLAPPVLQWTGTLSGEEVVEGLRAADVMVLPYRDGASLRRGTLCAALACGRPTVTTMPRTPVPILRDGENILFELPENPQAVAAQVARLLDDEAFRQRMGQAASALAPHFDWDTIAGQHVTIYPELLGTP